MFGTNDAKQFNWFGIQGNLPDSYFIDYVNMIHTMQRLPTKPKVLIMSLVPLYAPYPYDMNQTIIDDILSGPGATLAQLAASVADGFIDMHAAFVKAGFGPNITCDGCHPMDPGYEFMAQVIASAIKHMVHDDSPLLEPDFESAEFAALAAAVNSQAVRATHTHELLAAKGMLTLQTAAEADVMGLP